MFGALILLLSQFAAVPNPASRCQRYEPAVVSLSGKLVRETFPGPPHYHDVKEGDEAETFFLLVLTKPLCTVVDQNDFSNRAEKSVEKLQLVFLDNAIERYTKYRSYLGTNVQCEGKLFSAHTGHHYTPVLMIVDNCKPIAPFGENPKLK